jgi:hypothetical protein
MLAQFITCHRYRQTNAPKAMRTEITFVWICMVICAANLCIAQPPKEPPVPTKWGRSVEGVQLSIGATNTVAGAGAAIWVATVITNKSTNAISVVESRRETDYDLLLTNVANRVYHLTPRFALFSRHMEPLNPGKAYVLTIPVAFPSNIEPGEYTLIATRGFSSSGGGFNVESNPLQITITPATGPPVRWPGSIPAAASDLPRRGLTNGATP